MTKTRFLKRVVLFCIAFITTFTITSVWLNFKVGMEISPTLTTCVYSFFGTEMVATALMRIIEEWKEKPTATPDEAQQPAEEQSSKVFYN